MSVAGVLARLRALADPTRLAGMARYGGGPGARWLAADLLSEPR